MKQYKYRNFDVDVYGDGRYEYEGYYMIVIVEFNNSDKEISKKRIYLKCETRDIKRSLDIIINDYELLNNNEKTTCKLELKKEG